MRESREITPRSAGEPDGERDEASETAANSTFSSPLTQACGSIQASYVQTYRTFYLGRQEKNYRDN